MSIQAEAGRDFSISAICVAPTGGYLPAKSNFCRRGTQIIVGSNTAAEIAEAAAIAAQLCELIAKIILHEGERFAPDIEPEYAIDAAACRMRVVAIPVQPKAVLGGLETALGIIRPGIFRKIDWRDIKGTVQSLSRALLFR